jgi:hypothetical protein
VGTNDVYDTPVSSCKPITSNVPEDAKLGSLVSVVADIAATTQAAPAAGTAELVNVRAILYTPPPLLIMVTLLAPAPALPAAPVERLKLAYTSVAAKPDETVSCTRVTVPALT